MQTWQINHLPEVFLFPMKCSQWVPLSITEEHLHLRLTFLSDSKFTINIHYDNKKNGKKIINYHHKSLYIPVKCTMQQSVNGNIERKTTGGRGGFAGNKASTAVSSAVFLVCFGCITCAGLDSSGCQVKKKKKKND